MCFVGNGACTRCREAAALLLAAKKIQAFWGENEGITAAADRSKGSPRNVTQRLSDKERQRILLTCKEPEFAALPAAQIAPVLADRGPINSCGEDFFEGSERQLLPGLASPWAGPSPRQGTAPMEPRPVPRLRADGPNQV